MTGTVLAGHVVLAIQDNKVSPGVLGFLVVAALGVATWLLIRSMNHQIHKIDFSEDAIDVGRQTPPIPEPNVAAPAPDPDGAAADGDEERRPDG
jgi:hypothetical protein